MSQKIIPHKYKLKRAKAEVAEKLNPLLLEGEPIVITQQTKKGPVTKLKIGDGKTRYNELSFLGGEGSGLVEITEPCHIATLDVGTYMVRGTNSGANGKVIVKNVTDDKTVDEELLTITDGLLLITSNVKNIVSEDPIGDVEECLVTFTAHGIISDPSNLYLKNNRNSITVSNLRIIKSPISENDFIEGNWYTYDNIVIKEPIYQYVDDLYNIDKEECEATGYKAHVHGVRNKATGVASNAQGVDNIASGDHSTVEGYGNEASGGNSHAQGSGTKSKGLATHTEGVNTEASGDAAHSEGAETKSTGPVTHAEGYGTISSGVHSHGEGSGTQSKGYATHSEGVGSVAGTDPSVGAGAHAEGVNTQALKDGTHSEGIGTISNGVATHTEGVNTTATGDGAHGEGVNTQAIGPHSHSEGFGTISQGVQSHSEGGNTVAAGYGAHSQGINTQANGTASDSNGFETIANGDQQHVGGRYNIVDNDNKYAEIIGNGDALERSNARTLDWNGNGWYNGDIVARKFFVEDENLTTQLLIDNTAYVQAYTYQYTHGTTVSPYKGTNCASSQIPANRRFRLTISGDSLNVREDNILSCYDNAHEIHYIGNIWLLYPDDAYVDNGQDYVIYSTLSAGVTGNIVIDNTCWVKTRVAGTYTINLQLIQSCTKGDRHEIDIKSIKELEDTVNKFSESIDTKNLSATIIDMGIWDNATITPIQSVKTSYGQYTANMNPGILTPNQYYLVEFDGVEYRCKCTYYGEPYGWVVAHKDADFAIYSPTGSTTIFNAGDEAGGHTATLNRVDLNKSTDLLFYLDEFASQQQELNDTINKKHLLNKYASIKDNVVYTNDSDVSLNTKNIPIVSKGKSFVANDGAIDSIYDFTNVYDSVVVEKFTAKTQYKAAKNELYIQFNNAYDTDMSSIAGKYSYIVIKWPNLITYYTYTCSSGKITLTYVDNSPLFEWTYSTDDTSITSDKTIYHTGCKLFFGKILGENSNSFNTSTAYGKNSNAFGDNTIAKGENQTVLGKYNIIDTDNKYSVIVGNGTDEDNRSNAYTVDWYGNIEVNDISICSYKKIGSTTLLLENKSVWQNVESVGYNLLIPNRYYLVNCNNTEYILKCTQSSSDRCGIGSDECGIHLSQMLSNGYVTGYSSTGSSVWFSLSIIDDFAKEDLITYIDNIKEQHKQDVEILNNTIIQLSDLVTQLSDKINKLEENQNTVIADYNEASELIGGLEE